MGKDKVLVAIYDKDLKIRELKKFEVSEDGTKIRIKVGGEAHWMPSFDAESYLEFPTRKKYLFFGQRLFKRFYILPRRADKCINFSTGEVKGPDIEQLKRANKALLLEKLGQAEMQIPFFVTVILVLVLLFQIITLNVLGVF